MTLNTHNEGKPQARLIELHLREVSQLFNTMDPSPFNEKDLDEDAVEFIVNWAQEFPPESAISLVVHLDAFPEGENPQLMVEKAIRNYFQYRVKLNRIEFRRLMQDGRRSLVTGVLFLAACLSVSRLFIAETAGTFSSVAQESLAIAGWVAMWRPMETYLYDWWPLRRQERMFKKLSQMAVEVRKKINPEP